MTKRDSYSEIDMIRLIFLAGLTSIAGAFATGNMVVGASIISLPLLLTGFVNVIRKPVLIIYLIFFLNYFILGINRYVELPGVSLLIDILLFAALIMAIVHTRLYNSFEWKDAANLLTLLTGIWLIYCVLEVANPTSHFKSWVLSRGLIWNGFLISLVSALYFNKISYVKVIFDMLSAFTALAILKTLQQKYLGFDMFETRWLNQGGAVTHIIMTGTRYFSFFTDASNMGSNMGAATIIFGISSIYVKNKLRKVFYILLSIGAMLAMFLSGTRGAIIVPLAGMALFIVICKNMRIITAGGLTLVIVYLFFAFTNIGNGNTQIRRMRTAFTPTEDASFNVRKENQKILGEYLRNRPFGEGLGLSGVENQVNSMRFTTSIPNDSWYVKIWVETGIVGLILHLLMVLGVIARGAWILMFRIRDIRLRGVLGSLLCAVFGLFISAYGNPFWGQFPTTIIAYMSLAIVLKAEQFEQELNNTQQTI